MSRGWSDIVCASEGTVAWVEWWVKLAFFTKFQSQSIPTHMWRIFKVLCSTAEKRVFLLGGRFFKQTLAYNIIVTKRPRNILHWCNLVATVEVQNATKTYIYIYQGVFTKIWLQIGPRIWFSLQHELLQVRTGLEVHHLNGICCSKVSLASLLSSSCFRHRACSCQVCSRFKECSPLRSLCDCLLHVLSKQHVITAPWIIIKHYRHLQISTRHGWMGRCTHKKNSNTNYTPSLKWKSTTQHCTNMQMTQHQKSEQASWSHSFPEWTAKLKVDVQRSLIPTQPHGRHGHPSKLVTSKLLSQRWGKICWAPSRSHLRSKTTLA